MWSRCEHNKETDMFTRVSTAEPKHNDRTWIQTRVWTSTRATLGKEDFRCYCLLETKRKQIRRCDVIPTFELLVHHYFTYFSKTFCGWVDHVLLFSSLFFELSIVFCLLYLSPVFSPSFVVPLLKLLFTFSRFLDTLITSSTFRLCSQHFSFILKVLTTSSNILTLLYGQVSVLIF